MAKVTDLRSAIELLKTIPGQYIETDIEVDPKDELSGVYRHVGAGGTVQRPTKLGPCMTFNNIKGQPYSRVHIGLLASRERVGLLLDRDPKRIAFDLVEAAENPIAPVVIEGKPPCQEVTYSANDPHFDIRRILPAPTNTPDDAGPYLTLGLCYAHDPETGAHDVTIHRMCLQGHDTLSFYAVPGARHIGHFYEVAEKLNQPLPISISIGVDPAIEVSCCFEPPTTGLGFDELSIAGALRGAPVELAKCKTIDEYAIAHAEYVIEGELMPKGRIAEDSTTGSGFAMPEFPGYTGLAVAELPYIRVKAITTRRDPIFQTCIGPSEEHVSMTGLPTEASILRMVNAAMPGKLKNVYCASPGGGKYMAILQFVKSVPSDEGRQRQAALLAFSAFPELKNVILVDEDVDPFDIGDVLWAMNTRMQSDNDVISIPGVRCHPLDPSNDPTMSPSIRDHGIATKTIFDCTVPFDQKHRFVRSRFADIDKDKWADVLGL